LADSYIIRAKNSHSWVEIYDDEKEEWIIFDPTPSNYSSINNENLAIFDFVVDLYDYIDIKWYTYIVNFT
jgi:transglutaminase-like putative cysteine protease